VDETTRAVYMREMQVGLYRVGQEIGNTQLMDACLKSGLGYDQNPHPRISDGIVAGDMSPPIEYLFPGSSQEVISVVKGCEQQATFLQYALRLLSDTLDPESVASYIKIAGMYVPNSMDVMIVINNAGSPEGYHQVASRFGSDEVDYFITERKHNRRQLLIHDVGRHAKTLETELFYGAIDMAEDYGRLGSKILRIVPEDHRSAKRIIGLFGEPEIKNIIDTYEGDREGLVNNMGFLMSQIGYRRLFCRTMRKAKRFSKERELPLEYLLKQMMNFGDKNRHYGREVPLLLMKFWNWAKEKYPVIPA